MERDDRKSSREDERLLERAKRYVEKHDKRKSSSSRRHREDDGSRHRDRKKSSRKRRHDDGHRDERKKNSRGEGDREGKREKSQEREGKREKSREREGKREKPREREGKREKSREKEKREKDRKRGKPGPRFPLGPVAGTPPPILLSEQDYFTHHDHFRLWLFREKGARFEDLSSEKARSSFAKFVRRYNEGALERDYYGEKPPPLALKECQRTAHGWSFETSLPERRFAEGIREIVRKQTDREDARPPPLPPPPRRVEVAPRPSRESRAEERTENRRLRGHVQTVMEELTGGKKEGRERQIEKAREKAAALHGSAKDREEGAAGAMLDDKTLYGDSAGDSFKAALNRDRRRKELREEKRNGRVRELMQKEKEKQANMLRMLGLDNLQPGQRIQIAPRDD